MVYGVDHLKYEGKEAPARRLQKLETAGIPTKWVSEDVRAKELFDITTDRVSLISIHSAKGLDFYLVYMVGADQIIATDETRDRLIRLLYVAITRATGHPIRGGNRFYIPFQDLLGQSV